MFNVARADEVLDEYLLGDALRLGVADGRGALAEYRFIYDQDMPEDEAAELAPLSGEWAASLTPSALTADLFADAGIDLEGAPEDWLSEAECAIADEYERGVFEGATGQAVPCERSWPRAICQVPGTYCDCEMTARV